MVDLDKLRQLGLFVFSDAGFASLRGSKSIEAAIAIGWKDISRGGSIICSGSPLGFYNRKISRVCRPTIAAEAVATANGIELCLWHHNIPTELISGKVIDLRHR